MSIQSHICRAYDDIFLCSESAYYSLCVGHLYITLDSIPTSAVQWWKWFLVIFSPPLFIQGNTSSISDRRDTGCRNYESIVMPVAFPFRVVDIGILGPFSQAAVGA